MNTTSELQTDYRKSHLGKGADYDSALSEGPFDHYMTQHQLGILARVLKKLYPNGVPRYMDFACGTGRITQFVEEMATESVAVDVSATMLAEARKKCRYTTFRLCDITQDSVDFEPFNLVSAFRFFGNAQDELRVSALQAIHSLMVDGGYLVFNNHRNPWSLARFLRRCRGERSDVDLSYSKIKRLLRSTGFTIHRSYGIGWWIMRHRWNTSQYLDSRLARFLEPLSRSRWLAPFCPDYVVVAQKKRLS